MNAAQISAAPDLTDESFHDWRAYAACLTLDPDLFFVSNEPEVEALAKSVCGSCPVRQRCLDNAMLANEEYGIFGGMTPPERKNYRRMWERMQGGKGAVRTQRKQNGILVHDPAINRRYEARLRAAQECYRKAVAAGPFHRREEFLAVLELIIKYPTEDSGKLGRRGGCSKAWFNTMKREVFAMFDVVEDAYGEGEIA